ncbi:MAG: septation regulator SpoVG [Chitinispirillaceae bacterium]|nr:septation regulator SpoVG [Chitinispirillaceae bacterium]
MTITEVRVTLKDQATLKAVASITFDDCFVIHNLKVINGTNGYFVSMPSRRKRCGLFKDIAHPITNEMRKKIESAIFDAFESERIRAKAAELRTATKNIAPAVATAVDPSSI